MQNDIYEFYKNNSNDIVWKVTHYRIYNKEKGFIDGNYDVILGEILFSFDKKKIYNLWTDYPNKFTKEEKEIFDKENPFWANFFKDRNSSQLDKSE